MTARTTPRLAGLALALLGLPLIAALPPCSGDPLHANLVAQLLIAGVVVAVVALVRWGERRPVSSLLWWRGPAHTALWSVVLTAFNVTVFAPAAGWLLHQLATPGFDVGIEAVSELPRWYRVAIVVWLAPVEELLYRGYAISRLVELTQRPWLAAAISSLLFGLAHFPLWGMGPALVLVLPSAVGAAFYLWRRDLPALMISHVATDLIGLAG